MTEIHSLCREALDFEPEYLDLLVNRLGVSPGALKAFEVGWRSLNPRPGGGTGYGPAWTFPMKDGRGRVVGVQRRFVDETHTKRCISESHLGMHVPRDWECRPGVVLLPEGVSDAATLWDLGFCAVGRPSNLAGAATAAELFGATDRDLIVLGENDLKPDARWPGDPGPFASKLSALLGRPVYKVLPPAAHKDVRDWRAASGDAAVRDGLLGLISAARSLRAAPGTIVIRV